MIKKLFAVVLLLLVAVASNATSTFIIWGGGYEIHVIISDSFPEQIVEVRFAGPSQSTMVALSPSELSDMVLDCNKEKMVFVYRSAGDHSSLSSFKVSVSHAKARLRINGHTIAMSCDWAR